MPDVRNTQKKIVYFIKSSFQKKRLKQSWNIQGNSKNGTTNMWNYLKLRLLLTAAILGLIDYAAASTKDTYTGARLGHRIVQTRYGRLHGLILPLDNFRLLRSVEVFLGVPYATPPTKQNRFVSYNLSILRSITEIKKYYWSQLTDSVQHVRLRPGKVFVSRIPIVQCALNVCRTFKMRQPHWRRCQKVAWSTWSVYCHIWRINPKTACI